MDSDEDSLFSSSSSSDEDEEFLTTSKTKSSNNKIAGTAEDREALIRRKLLENFYGKASSASEEGGGAPVSSSKATTTTTTTAKKATISTVNTDHENTTRKGKLVATTPTRTNSIQPPSAPQSPSFTDLDSPTFRPKQYSSNLISTSTTHNLLSSSSSLTQSTRLLDSTMQTLVYENYSKFIDATDAIRSIGQSVSVSEKGLQTLSSSIESIESNMKNVENQLKHRRNEVAEKIRVKRLLMRLTRLLELPVTLKVLRGEKKYRLVMKDYHDAMIIIGQHSDGFESLKKIEMDCGCIVEQMVWDLSRMVWIWCGGNDSGRIFFAKNLMNQGNSTNLNYGDSGIGIMGVSDVLDTLMRNGRIFFQSAQSNDDTISTHQSDDSSIDTGHRERENSTNSSSIVDISTPQSVAEIFECTVALLNFATHRGTRYSTSSNSKEEYYSNDVVMLLSRLTALECKVMSLECCTKYLDGILEDHIVDVQEERLKTIQELEVRMALNSEKDKEASAIKKDNHGLFPRKYLDTILEVATLYGVTFNALDEKVELLNKYVTTWFTSFLGHVRMILMEKISEINSKKQSRKNETEENSLTIDQDDQDDAAFADISNELMRLLSSVREVASGLALPEIGLDMELASSLVEKTVGITESMVKKRVAQKFHLLRIRVLKDSLTPLVEGIIEEECVSTDDASLRTIKKVQAANIALSDGMQMVDDTIRSILSKSTGLGMSNTPLDLDMVKVAVSNNACQFAIWLASVIETIAGCEPDDKDITMGVQFSDANIDDGTLREFVVNESVIEANDEDETNSPEKKKECLMLENLLVLVQENEYQHSNALLQLSLVEMCRLAARNVVNNMNQSISSSMEDDNKQSLKLDVFQTSMQLQSSSIDGKKGEMISTRFRLAASRSLILYATAKGYEASSGVCQDLWETCNHQSEFSPHGPKEATWKMLEIAKNISIESAAAFGGNIQAGPIPNFEDNSNDYMANMSARHNVKGLSLDVARMFTQKIQVYPHHSEIIEFSRNAVVALMLKVACKAWIEQIRLCTISSYSYRQLQIDTEFLKILLPHYVDDESQCMEELHNILIDVVLNAGGRCADLECVGVTEYFDEARGKVLSPNSIAMGFLVEEDAAGKRGVLGQFLIDDQDESSNNEKD